MAVDNYDWKNPFEGRLGVSIGEVAEALGVCKNTVRKELPNFDVTYFGDKPVISVSSVVRRLNEKKTHAEPMRRPLGISLAALDSNYATDDCLAYARRHPPYRLIAIRGAHGDAAPRIARVQRERDEKRGTVLKYSARFYNIGVNQFKASLYRDLAKDDPAQPGYISFPTGCEDRLFQEIMGETRVMHKRMGMAYFRWEPIAARQATEMLDALVYASAAAIKHGVNAISDKGWQALETKLEGPPDGATNPLLISGPPPDMADIFARLERE